MEKKGKTLPLEFLISLILGIIVFSFTFFLIRGCLKIDPTADRSFKDFAEKLNSFADKEVGTIEGFNLFMAEDSGVYLFNKDQSNIKIWKRELREGREYNILDREFKRPIKSPCLLQDACLCLCKEIEHSGGEPKEFWCEEEKYSCFTLNITLVSSTNLSELASLFTLNPETWDPDLEETFWSRINSFFLSDGFGIERTKGSSSFLIPSLLDAWDSLEKRIKSVWIKKMDQQTIKLCLDPKYCE